MNGWTFTWHGGRQLAGMSNGTTTLSFGYNDSGMRTSKTVGNTTHTYTYQGSTLVADKTATDAMYFHYDQNGSIIGFTYDNGTTSADYYYVKNLQGDILGILDVNGALIASYTYDAWGNILTVDGSNSALATRNPIRYRGYYYDVESELYYLQSRYYDAAIGRFISADGLVSSSTGILGYNMFAYCNNAPIAFYDPDGYRHEMHAGIGGSFDDYVIVYYHPESQLNMDFVAIRNHLLQNVKFAFVASFEELADAVNNIPRDANDIFIYVHGGSDNLCFYHGNYYYADDISKSFEEVLIRGDIYLLSCSGGREDIAATMARATQCTVIASQFGVNFCDGGAYCSLRDYFGTDSSTREYGWYRHLPNGNRSPYSSFSINVR